MKRLISALLLLALLLGCLPVSALADDAALPAAEEIASSAPAEDTGAEEAPAVQEMPAEAALSADVDSFFYFSAETKTKLLTAPVKIPFAAGQSIRDALLAAGISLEFDDQMLSAVEGVVANYTWLSAPNNKNLSDAPEQGSFFCITESKDGPLASGWQQLMVQMADYLLEAEDVRLAAKDAYDAACRNYCGVSDTDAASYAQEIASAISAYKAGQDKTHTVSFGSDFSGCEIKAENAYGKTFKAATDGTLSLPDGTYTFSIRKDNKAVMGKLTVAGQNLNITDVPALPTEEWFSEDDFAVSTVTGFSNEQDFINNKLVLNTTDDAHVYTAALLDTFVGSLYPYVALSSSAPEDVTLSALYTDKNGTAQNKENFPRKSKQEPIAGVLARGTAGNTVIFRASKASGSYTLCEDLTLKLDRQPTLSALRIEGGSGNKPAADTKFSNQTFQYTYKILEDETTLKIYPTASVSGCAIFVDGKEMTGDYAEVTLSQEKDENDNRKPQTITVRVKGGDYETTYTLTIQPGAGTKVTVKLINGVTDIVMKNANGEVLESRQEGYNSYIYTLVVGEKYRYYATKNTYSHIERTFTLASTDKTSFDVEIPDGQVPSLDKLSVSTSSSFPITGDLISGFSSDTHAYTAVVPDNAASIAVWADPAAGSGAKCTVGYTMISSSAKNDGKWETTDSIVKTNDSGTVLMNAVLNGNASGNTLTFTVSKTTGDTTYSADYVVTLKRSLTLSNMTASCGGSEVKLSYTSDNKQWTGFTPSQKTYEITVPSAASFLDLTLTARSGRRYGETDSGYLLYVNGEAANSGEAFQARLSGDAKTDTITVTVKSRYDETVSTDYTITVNKAASTTASFKLSPSDANLYIYEKVSGNRLWPDASGKYAFSTGFTYIYSFTKYGFAGKSGAIQLTDGELDLGKLVKNEDGAEEFESEKKYDTASAIELTLTAAPANDKIKKNTEALWADFRGTAYDANGKMTGTANTNNGVTSAAVPFSAGDGTLYWASGVGKGYASSAVSNPILVDGCLIVYAGAQILKIDKDTGEVLKSGAMAGTSSYAINNPTYAEGMILVGLADGRIQAFNADTLESLWLYTDPLGGQPDCPITVSNGYAYTGFWNSEVADASFVCLSLTDEDPTQAQEAKAPTWRYVQKGGFYWAGAYACKDYILVGTDDGKSGYSSSTANLLLLDPVSGKLLDSMTGFRGDIRCSICYADGTFYFTSKGSRFYSVQVAKENGAWKITNKTELDLSGMSTSTPVIANKRAYIGVSGASQFSPYTGHNITVIDLSGSAPKIAYKVPTQGYPQTSGLLTTAYGEYTYVYFFDNYTPGKLRVLRDKAGQTSADYLTAEDFDGKTLQTAYALFTPNGAQAQYAICSPIADENGTLYFKNDSGYLMAYGSTVKELTVTSQPEKTSYQAGETFDAKGLVVTAEYQNGVKRDVTKLMKFAENKLTETDTSVTLVYGKDQTMYHNEQNTDGTMESGVKTTANLTVEISITVTAATKTGTIGGSLSWTYTSGKLTLAGSFPAEAKTLIAAVYDENGRLTETKAVTTTGDVTLKDGESIRLFLLNANSQPVCASAAVKGS